jgi:hypothetical protein
MQKIKIVLDGFDKEVAYLKHNLDRIESVSVDFIPKTRVTQVQMKNGEIREYHGALAVAIFNFLN